VRHLQLHGAGTRLPVLCTIRTASSVRVRRARLHLIRWPLSAKASGAYLFRHRSAITCTHAVQKNCIGPHLIPNRDRKRCLFKTAFPINVCVCACVCVRVQQGRQRRILFKSRVVSYKVDRNSKTVVIWFFASTGGILET